MSTALALIQTTEFDLMKSLASVAFKSGYTKLNEAQLIFVMVKGFELGISPMQALDGIQVIQGKTTVAPQLMLALINRSGQLENMEIKGDATQCTVTMTRKGRSPHIETFTLENARTMGLAGNHNWKAQPATMLKWRAVSACARIVFPDIIQGMYTPEEMGAEMSENANGDLIVETPTVLQLPIGNVVKETGEITDGEIVSETVAKSNEEATSSDFTVEVGQEVTPAIKQTAKDKLTQERPGVIPLNEDKAAFSITGLLAKMSTVAPDFGWEERGNTVKKMETEGAFVDVKTLDVAAQLVLARLTSPEHGKKKKAAGDNELLPDNQVQF